MQAQEVLKNFTVAKISVPVHGNGMVELDCVVHMTAPPYFEATFLPDQLPASRLDLEKACKVFYFANGQGHLLNSQISKVLSKEKLLLAVKKNKIFNHARDYFRVDASGRVHFELVSKRETDLREYEGIINISGGGARFPVRDNFSLNQKIRLNFFFKSPLEAEIDCLGEVVRARNFHLNKDLAIKFIQIDPKAREKLISLCMAIQREELRTKVQISNPFGTD